MAAISHIAAFPDAPARPQKGGERAAMAFGGAVTYRELVQAKLRVDPVSLAEKKRQADPVRKREDPPRESVRAQRFAEQDAYEEPGGRLDISV